MALYATTDLLMLIFVTVSVPYYILFLITILINRRKEPFNSSFFTLCTSLGVADIGAILQSYIFLKAPGWSWGHAFWIEYGYQGSFLAFYGYAMMWAFALAQHIGVLLIGINRFTAVAFTFRQERIWSKRNITIAIALQWIVPIIFVLPMTTTTFAYDYWRNASFVVSSDNVNIDFCDINYQEGYYIAAVFINLIVNITTCGMYIAVLVTALRVSKKFKVARIDPTKTNDSSKSNIDGNEPKPGSNRSLGKPDPAAGQIISVEGPHIESNGEGDRFHEERAQKKSLTQTSAMNTQQRRSTHVAIAMVSGRQAYVRELRLAVCGFLMFLSMLVYLVFLLGVAVGGTYGFQFTYLWNIASDIFACISPYTLIIMSKQTRMAVRKLVTCKRI